MTFFFVFGILAVIEVLKGSKNCGWAFHRLKLLVGKNKDEVEDKVEDRVFQMMIEASEGKKMNKMLRFSVL